MARKLFLACAATLLLSPSAFGQMNSGERMKNYEAVFGVQIDHPAYPYDIVLMESHPAGNVLAPDEQPSFTFLFRNNLARPLHTAGRIDILSYGTRGIPGDIWTPELFKIADLAPLPLQVDLPAHGSQVISIATRLPATFGAYAFVADLGAEGRRFATSCVRTFAATPEKIQYPKLSLDDSVGVDVLRKLGVQAIRMQCPYLPTTDPNYPAQMAELDRKLEAFSRNNITVMLMFLSGSHTPEVLGRGRPHLSPENIMLDTKQDLAWAPEYDTDFQHFVTAICKRKGWPRGPVTAVELWNEPWDGISISGWGADSLRFREIYTAMARGVEAGRGDGAEVLLGGCDSVTNTFDKLFPDGKDTFLKWFDVCTIHYQGLTAPVLYRDWINRKSPYGRVKIWDTESWVANTDDRVATIVAADRAAGYDRAMGVYGGNISTENKQAVVLPDGTAKQVDTFHAWSTAAAVGAAQHFIGERAFHGLLFRNGLPWVMLFDGTKNRAEDGTVVIVGDLKEEFGDLLLFRGVRGLAELKEKEVLQQKLATLPSDAPERAELARQLSAGSILHGASLVLKNPAREFVLYDFYGNSIPGAGDTIKVPLDQRGFFLRTQGAPGSFARLTQALSASRLEGYEPLNVAAHDLLAPIAQKPSLHLSLTNILNRPVSGTVQVTLGNLPLNVPSRLDFQPGETREVFWPVTGGAPNPDNTYPLTFRFDAGADGFAIHSENLHVNVIARRTITVDGNLDDWKGVLPQTIYAAGNQGPSLMEAAWLPFEKFSASAKPGVATGYLAYDDKNFYFAARIADSTPSPGTLRYEKRNDDDYFYPPVSYEYDSAKTLLKTDYTWQQPLRAAAALFLPHSTTQRSFTAWTSVSKAFAVDFDLPRDSRKQISFYFVDWDDYQQGRRQVSLEVHDAGSGEMLAHTLVAGYGPGAYVRFLLSGKVRVIFRSQGFLNASLSGIFLDPAPSAGSDAGAAASAAFVGIDRETKSRWEGTYGHDGYHLAGSDPAYPDYARVTVPEVVEKKEHAWPEGVRRYSYRKRPDLPFGANPNKFDNVEIAFNVIPMDQKSDMIPFPPGTMPNFIPHSDTDYEYALNKVADAYGGGTEIWRCLVPGMPRKGFYPRQPASPQDGPVKDGRLAVDRDDHTRWLEASLPWTEIPLVKAAMDSGKTLKFSFRVNDNDGPAMELAEERSVSKKNSFTFHPDWAEHWANEVEFSFEK